MKAVSAFLAFLIFCSFQIEDQRKLPKGMDAGSLSAFQTGGNFSCLVNGVPFSSGGGKGGLSNCAFKNDGGFISFSLVSLDTKYKQSIPPQIGFIIAGSGTSHFNAGDPHIPYSAKYSPAGYTDAYNAQSGSCTITALSANQISGIFSATFSGMGKSFIVTNGKFDLPRSGYSKPLQ
jgi:hypothetical protein